MDTVKKPNRCSTPVLDLFLGMTLIIRTCHRQRACRMGDGASSTGTTHQEWLVLICEIMRAEIIELPFTAGNHSSSFVTENIEYVTAGTRFSIPIPQLAVSMTVRTRNFVA